MVVLGPMPRHQMWRLQYRQYRYARHLSQAELNTRIRDIFLNQLTVTADGKVGPIQINERTRHWPEIWTHVLEEMQLRHGPFPAGFTREVLHSEPFPNFASELARRAATALAALHADESQVLVKFGKRVHMEALLKRGAIRVQPASFFSRMEHIGAIRDDELRLSWSVVLSREDLVRLVRNPEEVPPGAAEQRLDVEFGAPSDYWLYCVSAAIEPRLFVDFGADACVIIRDKTKFADRLRRGESEALRAAEFREGAATYIDPLRPKSSKVFVPLAKHFRYTYQKEYRFVWLPRRTAGTLFHVDMEVGPLDDIAELIVL